MGLFKKPNMEASFSSAASLAAAENQDSEAYSVVSKNTIVQGSVSTRDPIDIVGAVQGNVTCKKTATVSGIIEGDVRCDSAFLQRGKVKGNIKGNGTIGIDENSIAIGSLFSASRLLCDGKIKGNIQTSDEIALAANSMVLGNLTSASLSIEPGAMVKGRIEVVKDTSLTASMFKIEEEFMDINIFKESNE